MASSMLNRAMGDDARGNTFNIGELTQLAGINSWRDQEPTGVAATMAAKMASLASNQILYDPTATRYPNWLRSNDVLGPFTLNAAVEGGVDTEGFSAFQIEVSQADGIHATKFDPVWFYPRRRDTSVLDSTRWDAMALQQRRRVDGADNLAHHHLDSRVGSGKFRLVDVANLAEVNRFMINVQAEILLSHDLLDNKGDIPKFHFDVLGPARHYAGSREPERMSLEAPSNMPFLAGVCAATAAASNHPMSNPAFNSYAASNAAMNAAEASFSRGSPPAGNITMSIQDHGRAELEDIWPKLGRFNTAFVQGEALSFVLRPALVNLDKQDQNYILPDEFFRGGYDRVRANYPTSSVRTFVESRDEAKHIRCAWMYYVFPLALPTTRAGTILRNSWFAENQRSPPRGSMSMSEYAHQQLAGWDPKEHGKGDDLFRDAIAVLPLGHRSGYTPANRVADSDYMSNYASMRGIGHMTVAMLNDIGRVVTTYRQ